MTIKHNHPFGKSCNSCGHNSLHLTPREQDLIGLIQKGLSNKELGKELNLSVGTIKVYLSRLYIKVGYDTTKFGHRGFALWIARNFPAVYLWDYTLPEGFVASEAIAA